MNPWAGIAAFLGMLALLTGAIRLWQRIAQPAPELPRKLMHIGTGLLTLAIPWLFRENWPVLLLGATSLTAMTALRLLPALRAGTGQILHAVQRESLGELCFPVSVTVLFVLAKGDWVLFTIPMLVLTLADAAAALIGVRYGHNRYRAADGRKSREGSAAFFAVAAICAWVPLHLGTGMEPLAVALAALLIGLLVMLIEAASWRGLDNLFTPLLTFALVVVFRRLEIEALVVRLIVLALIAAGAFALRRRTRLDTGALLGTVLFVYVCWALGGWSWVAAPALLLAVHAVVWPRGRRELPRHDARAVFSLAVPGLLSLLLHVLGEDVSNGVVYATILAVIGADEAAARRPDRSRTLQLAGWIAAAMVLVLLPARWAAAGAFVFPSWREVIAVAVAAPLYGLIDRRHPLAAPWSHRVTGGCALLALCVAG
jgi:phytol kinase